MPIVISFKEMVINSALLLFLHYLLQNQKHYLRGVSWGYGMTISWEFGMMAVHSCFLIAWKRRNESTQCLPYPCFLVSKFYFEFHWRDQESQTNISKLLNKYVLYSQYNWL